MDNIKSDKLLINGVVVKEVLMYIIFPLIVVVTLTTMLVFNDRTYKSKGDSFTINSTKEMDNYLDNSNVVNLIDSSYSTDVNGISNLIDDYRKPLYKYLTNKGTREFKKSDPLTVYRVFDDGKKLVIEMVRNDKKRVEYYNNDRKLLDDTLDTRFLNSDEIKLLFSVAYLYKNDRDVNIKFGKIKTNKYNKRVFVKSDEELYDYPEYQDDMEPNKVRNLNEYYFKKSELLKVDGWDTYTGNRLIKLNEYKQKK